MLEPPLLQLAIWIAGTIPATFIAGRREQTWEDQGINTGIAVPGAIVGWPVWLLIFVLSPLARAGEWFYGTIYAMAKPQARDANLPRHPPGE